MNTVTIEKKKYPYLFGMAVLKRFAATKKEKSINKALASITEIDFNDPSPENMDDLANLLLSAIQRGMRKNGKECTLNEDDMIDWIYSGSSDLTEMINAFSESIGSGEDATPTKSGKAAA